MLLSRHLLQLLFHHVLLEYQQLRESRRRPRLLAEVKDPDLHPNYKRAFHKNSRWWRTIFWPNPAGWGKRTAARLEKVLDDSNAYIQKLNDEYTNPSGSDNIAAEIDQQAPEDSQPPDFSQAVSGNSMPDNTDPLTSKN